MYSDDDTDMDIHKVKITCEHLFNSALGMFFNGGDKFKGDQSVTKMKFLMKGKELDLTVLQSDITLNKDASDEAELESSEKNAITEEIIDNFTYQIGKHSIENHNDWVKNFGLYLKQLMTDRKKYIL